MAREDDTLDIHGAARLLGVHVQTVRRLARCNQIPSYKVGKLWRFSRNGLRRWAERHHERSKAGHVLVVDDQETIQAFLRYALESEGYRVSAALGGAEALEMMRRDLPDLVILDLKMPEMNGPAVLKEIRGAYGMLPVVILTAYPDSDLMNEAMRYSPILLLPKPVGHEQVLQTVRMALNGSLARERTT